MHHILYDAHISAGKDVYMFKRINEKVYQAVKGCAERFAERLQDDAEDVRNAIVESAEAVPDFALACDTDCGTRKAAAFLYAVI